MSLFSHLKNVAPDTVFGLQATYRQDPRKDKINLAIGVYQNEEGLTPTMQAVNVAQERLLHENPCREYLPIDGYLPFLQQIGEVVLGKQLWDRLHGHMYVAQTIGGTGALAIGGQLLVQNGKKEIYIPRPTWANHKGVFSGCQMKTEEYFYYDFENKIFDFHKLYRSLETIPDKSVVLLHGVCHNPTGLDLSKEEWSKLCELFVEKSLFPFFDFAYQGFGRGLEEDREAIEIFASRNIPMFIATSYSKNFGLYGDRVGALFVLTASLEEKENVGSNIRKIIRENYSNPPMHGARIVSNILSDPSLTLMWKKELSKMRGRSSEMRQEFFRMLQEHSIQVPGHVMGLFCFLGLSEETTRVLREKEGLYLSFDGRMNVTGLNKRNIEKVVKKVVEVMK